MMQTTYLDAVLTRLSTAGLHLKKSKCVCMVSQVIYCGYRISGSEIEPVIEKVEAIQNAPAPQNVSQLRSFLWMLNYYHRFLPNLATTLEPLHKLLRQETPCMAVDTRTTPGIKCQNEGIVAIC
jgi:hypothetical protein